MQSRPNIPTTEKIYESIDIPGRDGVLYRDTGTVKDIKIEVPLAFREQAVSYTHLFWSFRKRKIYTSCLLDTTLGILMILS